MLLRGRTTVSQTEANHLQVIAAQWVLPVSQAPIEQGFVAYQEGRIVAVDHISALPADWLRVEPLPNTLLTPGLINAHVHLEQSFPTPIFKAPNEPFTAWLLRVIHQIQRNSTLEAKWQRCLVGAQEVLATGTTCVNDIASGPESLQVLDVLGLRGVVSLECFHPAVEPISMKHWVAQYQALQSAYENHPRLQIGLSPHSPYNVSPAAWQALLEACQPPLVHTHVAEFPDESRYLQGETACIRDLHQTVLGRSFAPQEPAKSPVEYLHRFGLLNDRTIVAHAIHTSPADRQTLAQAGTIVAHCPRSNMALHGETLRAADWIDPNIPLALGTDGRLSTENLDLRAEARYATTLHGWSAKIALEAMTLQGAKALGFAKDIGTLAPGMAADFVLWQVPPGIETSPEAQLLHPETRVQQVIIDGKVCWTTGEI